MRHRFTIVSLVALLFATAMVLPTLTVWAAAGTLGIHSIFYLFIGCLLILLLIFSLPLILRRFRPRR